MKTQMFRFSRSLWSALSALFVLALTLSSLTPAGAGTPAEMANQPVAATIVNQDDAGGQGADGSDAPHERHTSAFLAGKVAVGVIALESHPGTIGHRENWTSDELTDVRNEIVAGLAHWTAWAAGAGVPLEFVVDVNRDAIIAAGEPDFLAIDPVVIPYEPIVESSGQYGFWAKDALIAKYPDPVGVTETAQDKAYRYIKDLRANTGADWGFVLFVVDSSQDTDINPGAFSDGQYITSPTFGPLALMTYNNGTRGIANMEWVTAQLVARMFGAGFQREDPSFQVGGCGSTTKKFGYLGIANLYCGVPNPGGLEPNPRLMYERISGGEPDSITKQQLGWRDIDSDGIIDPLDTRPSVLFSPYYQDPTPEKILIYSEAGDRKYRAYDNPLPAAVCLNRPTDECFHSYYHDVTHDDLAITINKITMVQFRIDDNLWSEDVEYLAAAQDGDFDSDYEVYIITTPSLDGGKRKIEARARNSVSNYSKAMSDNITISDAPVNDLFASRIVIPSIPYNHAVSTNAILDEDEDDPTDPLPLSETCLNTRKGKRSVWYQYTAGGGDEVFLDTFGTDYATVLSVWKDTDGSGDITNEDELVACADSSGGDPSELFFTRQAGVTYYFMISEYNNIETSFAAGDSDVGGQAGGILIFHVSEIKNPSYLPMLFKKAFGGTYNSAFYLQNVSSTIPAKLIIKFYNSGGGLDCSIPAVIEPLASQGWWLPSLSCLPDNWVGGIYVTSTQPIVAVGRPHIGSEVMTYTGFNSGDIELFIPMLFKKAFGGTYNSAFYIQNVDVLAPADITIDFYNANGGLVCTITDTLQPLASKGWWVPGLTCLSDGWVGGAVVTSSKSIVAVGRPHIGNEVMTYNGFASGDITSYLPMLFKNAFGGGAYKSAFYIQNIHNSNVASVTIKYYNDAGVLNCTVTDTISPLASKGYWLPTVGCLPEGWVGGVAVTSDEPIVMVGRPHIGAQITTYNSFSAGSINSFVSMLFKNAFGGSYKAAFYIQNVDPFESANVTITYYNNAGGRVCSDTNTILPLASKGYWLPSVSCLPLAGWVGGAVITSDQPIVTVGRPHIGEQITTYAGFSVESGAP